MGLIKSALGSVMGAGQVQNGLGGSQLPFRNKTPTPSPSRRHDDDNDDEYYRYNNRSPGARNPRLSPQPQPYGVQRYSKSNDGYENYDEYDGSSMYTRNSRLSVPDPTGYQANPRRSSPHRNANRDTFYNNRPASSYDVRDDPPDYNGYSVGRNRPISRGRSGFAPIILPQIDYAEGSPFLRGYSDELQLRGISQRQFLEILDAINVAIIPNPENQIFQFGANIAGWFVPGAAGIGLMGGQLVSGLGTALGHRSIVNRVLSKANLEVFLPQDLEICIAKQQNIDNELGISQSSIQQQNMMGASPEERIDMYGDLVAPLCQILPPAQTGGRHDPIAMIGKGLAARQNQKKMGKAQKRMAKGRMMGQQNELDQDLKWLMIRQASPEAVAHWKTTLEQSDAAIKDEQAKQQQQQQQHQQMSRSS